MDLPKANARPLSQMIGEDTEETELFKRAADEAIAYLKSFKWCKNILETYFCFGVGGVVEVFLFRVNRPLSTISDGETIDEWLWVIVGDLPSAYVVTDEAESPRDALMTYCDEMREWVRTVLSKGDLRDVYPVGAQPTEKNASLLSKRIDFLESEIIPLVAASGTKGEVHDPHRPSP